MFANGNLSTNINNNEHTVLSKRENEIPAKSSFPDFVAYFFILWVSMAWLDAVDVLLAWILRYPIFPVVLAYPQIYVFGVNLMPESNDNFHKVGVFSLNHKSSFY